MGAAYYIVTDAEPDAFDAFVNGKAIARSASVIDGYADPLGLPTLDDLVSFSEETVRGMMEDAGLEEMPKWFKGEKWFPAETGIEWARALRSAVSKDHEQVEDADALLSDLAEFEAMFTKIKERSLRWHLAIDY